MILAAGFSLPLEHSRDRQGPPCLCQAPLPLRNGPPAQNPPPQKLPTYAAPVHGHVYAVRPLRSPNP